MLSIVKYDRAMKIQPETKQKVLDAVDNIRNKIENKGRTFNDSGILDEIEKAVRSEDCLEIRRIFSERLDRNLEKNSVWEEFVENGFQLSEVFDRLHKECPPQQ